MADKKTYDEDEHLAILTDRVARETASLTAERDQLATEKAEAENKLDAAESAKVAAEQRATQAEKDLADYKAEQETQREAASRAETRVAEVKRVASHLPDKFFTEARVARITAMTDEDFTAYAADLVDSGATASGGRPVPRETAMAGAPAAGGAGGQVVSAGRAFLLRNYEPTSTKE